MNTAIIMFTRLLLPGQTKTRLLPWLSGEECAGLHGAMLEDISRVIRRTEADFYVFYTPADLPGEVEKLKALVGGAFYCRQKGEGLGSRMEQAFSEVLKRGYEFCLLVGSDMPSVTVQALWKAFAILQSHDVVLGPTEDGGYWLVGLKQPFPPLFAYENYGTDSVLKDAVSICGRRGLSVGFADLLRDIDEPADLAYFERQMRRKKPVDYSCTEKFINELQCKPERFY